MMPIYFIKCNSNKSYEILKLLINWRKVGINCANHETKHIYLSQGNFCGDAVFSISEEYQSSAASIFLRKKVSYHALSNFSAFSRKKTYLGYVYQFCKPVLFKYFFLQQLLNYLPLPRKCQVSCMVHSKSLLFAACQTFLLLGIFIITFPSSNNQFRTLMVAHHGVY